MPRPHGTDWVVLAFFIPLVLTGIGFAVLATESVSTCVSGRCEGSTQFVTMLAATLTKSWILIIPLLLFTLIGSRVEAVRDSH
jgi:hypothetical protein